MANKIRQKYLEIKKTIQTLPTEVGEVAVNHALEAFKNEGLEGEPKWPARKDGTSSGSRTSRRNLLVKSGRLRGSIRILRKTTTSVTIGTKVKYAAIQNFGGTTHPQITAKMRRFAWSQYHKTGDIFWRNLATTKQSKLTVKIPARPFIKVTPALKREIREFVRSKIRVLF